MSEATKSGVISTRVDNLESRINAVHTGVKEFKAEFVKHDKTCAERWTESSLKLKLIFWVLSTVGGGVLIMLVKDVMELIGL